MRFSSFLVTSVLAVLSLAAPPSQEPLGLEPAAGSRRLPTSYQQINQVLPRQSFPNNFVFKVSQSQGGLDRIGTLLRFKGIPSDSFGYTLKLSFTFEFPINSTGSTQVNVFKLSNDITPSDTWETYFPNGRKGTPVGGFLFGTIFVTQKGAIVNSQTWESGFNYLFLLASDTQAGEVAFRDAGNNLSGIGGFFIEFGF